MLFVPPATTSSGPPEAPKVGRSFWDFATERATATLLFAFLIVLVIGIIIWVTFAIVAYRRSTRERRQFKFLGSALGPSVAETTSGHSSGNGKATPTDDPKPLEPVPPAPVAL